MGRKRRCIVCKGEGLLYLRASNSAFCQDHYVDYFERKVFRAVKSFNMFTTEDRILVAVSGGKDSIALLYLLHKHGYDVRGYYIDLGLGDYSEHSAEKVKNYSLSSGIDIVIEPVVELLGMGIADAAVKLRRPPCAICGTVKRYLMNRAAKEYNVLATGHNLDDEAATLLGNLLHWQTGYIERQSPSLEEEKTLSRKVKPLIYMSEYETASYAFMTGLNTLVEECPESKDATSITYKQALNGLEQTMPGTKIGFLKGFFKNRNNYFSGAEKNPEELKPCETCGYLTVAGLCSVCRIRQKLAGTPVQQLKQ